MKISPKERISGSQAVVILINYILGTGILTLPRTAAEKVKTPDVWLTVILGGIVATMAGFVMVKLSRRYPGKTFYHYSQEIAGKWLGRLICLFIISYFLVMAGFQIRALADITGNLLLEGTPSWAIVMPFMWVALYLSMGGLNPIARLFEMIFPITVIVFLLISFMSLKVFELDNLRPVLGLGVMPVLNGIKTTALSYSGVEVLLFLLAFMKRPDKSVKVLLVGMSFPLMFYMITVVMVIGALSVEGVVTRTWPTLDLIRSFEMPGLIFERFESLLFVIWIMQIFATFVIIYYLSVLGMSEVFNKDIYPFMYGMLPVIYLISMIPKNTNDLFKLGDIISNVWLYLFGLLPLPLLLIAKLKEGKREPQP